MLLTEREISFLKILCWCKSMPSLSGTVFEKTYPQEELLALKYFGLLSVSRNGRVIRPRPAAYNLLKDTGFECKADVKQQTNPRVLSRRNLASQILFTFYMAGISVFEDEIPRLIEKPIYVASFAARQRDNNNPFGSTRFFGICCTGQEAFLIFYADNFGLFYQKELSLFHNFIQAAGIEKHAVIFMGKSTREIAESVFNVPSAGKEKNPFKLSTFSDIFETTTLPIHFIPIGNAGAQILKFLLIPGYREATAKAVLKSRYRPPYPDMTDTDTVHYKPPNYPALVALDMDVRRIDRALEAAWSAGHEKIVLYALKEQIPFLKSRYGNAGKAEILGIDINLIKDSIGYDIQLSEPPITAYVTGEGRCFNVTDFAAYRKVGKQGQKEARTCTQPE